MLSARVIIIAAILILLPLSVFTVLQQTGYYNRAAAPEDSTDGAPTISLDPRSVTLSSGEESSLDIKINLNNRNVSLIETQLRFEYEGEKSPITILDAQGDEADLIQLRPGSVAGLSYIANDATDSPITGSSKHEVVMRLNAVAGNSESSFTMPGEFTYGTILFKGETAVADLAIRFVSENTKLTVVDGDAALLIPSEAKITVTGEAEMEIPEIESVYPLKGAVGDTVVIQGANLGSEQNDSTVEFNGVKVAEDGVKTWSTTGITVVVPKDAKSGKLKVTTSGGSVESTDIYEVEGDAAATAPFIENIFPRIIKPGDLVTVVGRNFGNAQETSKLMIGAVEVGTIASWSNVLIEARVPDEVVTGFIKVIAGNGTGVSTVCLEVEGTTASDSSCLLSAFNTVGVGVTEVTNSSVRVAWNTDVESSSQVKYGLDSTLSQTSEKKDVETLVTYHKIELIGLIPCTTYNFQTIAVAGDEKSSESEVSQFATLGCPTDAEIVDLTTETVAATGGEVKLTDSGETVKVALPDAYSTSENTIQIRKLDSSEAVTDLTAPVNTSVVGGNVYEFNAYATNEQKVTTFDKELTVTMTYTAEDAAKFNQSTLSIRRWTGTAWETLTNCQVNESSRIVTCTTATFSTYGLFGEEILGAADEADAGDNVGVGDTSSTGVGATGAGNVGIGTTTADSTGIGETEVGDDYVDRGEGGADDSFIQRESTPVVVPPKVVTTGVYSVARFLAVIGFSFIIMGFLLPFATKILNRSSSSSI